MRVLPGRDVTDRRLDVVRNPLYEVRTVLVLHVQHLFVDLSHRHATSEDGGHGQVAAMTGVTGSHHVLRVKHLLGQFGHRQGAVLPTTTRRQWGKARHEEVQTWKRDHVDGQLAKISV
jgi:hypothetical protein